MEKFRVDASNETEIDEDVKNAWFVFINEFVRCVSYHWTHYLKDLEVGVENPSFRGIMTASDEAYTMWLLKHKYKDVYSEAMAIKSTSLEMWLKNKPKRQPKSHDSKWKLDDFVDHHVSVKKKRANEQSNLLWEQLFFKRFLIKLKESGATKGPDSASKRSVNDTNLLDDDDELEKTDD